MPRSAGPPRAGPATSPPAQPIAVISILRVYGSSFGLPNPGLMPTRRERDEQVGIVDRAIKDLEKHGLHGRRPGHLHPQRGPDHRQGGPRPQVSYVVMDAVPATGIRRIIEGELTAVVRRRLRGTAELNMVDTAHANGH